MTVLVEAGEVFVFDILFYIYSVGVSELPLHSIVRLPWCLREFSEGRLRFSPFPCV